MSSRKIAKAKQGEEVKKEEPTAVAKNLLVSEANYKKIREDGMVIASSLLVMAAALKNDLKYMFAAALCCCTFSLGRLIRLFLSRKKKEA